MQPPSRRRTGADAELDRVLRARSAVEQDADLADRDPSDEPMLGFAGRLDAALVAALPLSAGVRSEGARLLAPEDTVLRFSGFDRIAAREARRFVRRAFRRTLDHLYRQARPGADRELRYEGLYDSVLRRDSLADACFAGRFPSYWTAHPSYAGRAQTVWTGEEIRLLSVGPYALRNDLRVERIVPRRRRADPRADRPGAVDRAARHPAGWHRRCTSPSGWLVIRDCVAVDGRARISVVHWQPQLQARVEAELFDDRFDRPALTLQIQGAAQPLRGEAEVGAFFHLRVF